MVLNNKTKLVLLAIVAIILLMNNVFQVYAAQGQGKNRIPTLAVYVYVINDDGGSMKASDFAVTVTAKNPSPAIFTGSEIGTIVTMKNSEYKVTELEVKGYTVSYSPGCSGRINNNEAKTCVVINDDIAPHLKVIKHVVNDNEGIGKASDFTLYVSGNNPTPSSFAGSEDGTDVEISQGWYYVWEDWNPDYISTYSSECSGEINVGEIKTCTITNDDKPKAQLTVFKNVINDNEGTAQASDFTINVWGDNPSPGSFTGSDEGTTVTIYAGDYGVYEDDWNHPDYYASYSDDCNGHIEGGEIKTCTITNYDKPKAQLTVIKNVINNNEGTAQASDFTLYVWGDYPSPESFTGSDEGTTVTIYAGDYGVYEDDWNHPDYYASYSDDCKGYIEGGEIKTCTITNDDIPSLPN